MIKKLTYNYFIKKFGLLFIILAMVFQTVNFVNFLTRNENNKNNF